MERKPSIRLAIASVLTVAGLSCAPIPKDVATDPAVKAESKRADFDGRIEEHSRRMLEEGRETFRYDAFGSEDFWGGSLRLHQAILGEKQGGVGAGLSPRQALQAGLKVDVGKLPRILATLRANKALLKGAISNVPGIGFRRLTDPDGDIATHLVVTFADAETASLVAKELGTKTLADSGWHVYHNMEHLLQRRVVSTFAQADQCFHSY